VVGFVQKGKYCWLVVDKPNKTGQLVLASDSVSNL
jgi:hypothetical protein